ncbi:MAG TPA: hypothetical protein VFH53_01495 [Phycisphaerae bacterium]|nr:hypothetical protein [Phycisphaerae bacterium]
MEPMRRVCGVARPVLPGRAHEVREKHWRTSRQCHTPRHAFAHAFAQLAAAAVLALAAGCQGPLSRDEKVEMLMTRSARLEEELLATRQRLAELEGTGRPAPEAAKAVEDPFRAVALRFGKFTGGLAADGRPGDQRLKVVLEPLDAEGDVVKRAGSLDLEAVELVGGKPRTLAEWKWTRQEFAKTWLSGLGLHAYVLKLDWPGGKPPASDRVLLRARFTTLSGEVLSAEQEITLRRRTP